MNVHEAVIIILEVCKTLEEIHLLGIRHYDLKPENILLTKDKHPKISDFGASRLQLAVSETTGKMMFTLFYAAPEQIDSKTYGEPNHRTDIYQLGVILYELITGIKPFIGPPVEVFRKILFEEPRKPSELKPGIPKELDKIILKALAKRKKERYQGAWEMISELEKIIKEL